MVAGVSISGSPANLVGGPTTASRNLISGNGFGFAGGNPAIAIGGAEAVGNVIQGNYIGTTADGTAALPNSGHGVMVFNAGDANVIGGPSASPGTGAGNVISGNLRDAVHFEGTGAVHTVQGNILGLNAAGTTAVPNGGFGISVNNNPGGHIIGGLAPGAGNVISGNQNIGIIFSAPGNVVQGNFIGTDITGTVDLGNAGGIFLNSSNNNTIGGPTAGAGNLISGNGNIFAGGQGIAGSPGIELNNFSAGNVIEGNRIGTKAAGVGPLGNSQVGVLLTRANNTTVRGNTIAFSGNSEGSTVSGVSGLAVQEGTGNALFGNRFFGNSGLAIDLNRDGVTANDAGDADAGPNNTQNYPVLTLATTTGEDATVEGALNSTPNAAFLLQFFAAATGDPSGHGEGETFLGSTTVTTDAAGDVAFTAELPAGTADGYAVSATATSLIDHDSNPATPPVPRDTSEFSLGVAAELITRVQFDAAALTVGEPGGPAVATVRRAGDLSGTVTVYYATSPGTATAGADYTHTEGTLTFAPGETVKPVPVPVANDTAVELDETFSLTLTNPTGGAVLGPRAVAVVTIDSEDLPAVAFGALTSSVNEGSPVAVLEVELSRSSPEVVTVDYQVIGGTATAGDDFSRPAGQLTFAPGQTRAVIPVFVLDDGVDEPAETVRVALVTPVHATLGVPFVHTLSILDDDDPAGANGVPDRVGDTNAEARVVDLFTVPRQFVADPIEASDTDVYAVDLRAGDFLAVDVDGIIQAGPQGTLYYPASTTTLAVVDPQGATTTVGRSREPEGGAFTDNPAYGFIAATAGTYYLRLTTSVATPKGYYIEFHRNGLAEGLQNADVLNQPGDMFAGLVGNRLLLRGPTGYGFAIRGNWEHTSTTNRAGLVATTYRVRATSGPLVLETAFGDVPLPAVRAGEAFVISTGSNRWGATFGKVTGIQNRLGIPGLVDLAADFVADTTGADIQTQMNGTWTIQLGTKLQSAKGLTQALGGVPYLVYESASRFAINFGKIQVDTSLGDPVGLLAALDLSDPSMFLKVAKVGPVSNVKLGLSWNGRIPFAALQQPDLVEPAFTHFYGHVYASGGFPLFAGISFAGDVAIDYDANDDGIILGGAGDPDALIRGELFNAGTINRVAGDFNLGANGTLHLKYSKYGIDFSTDIGRASAVYNGAEQGFWVKGIRGNNKSPFAGTPFEALGGTPEDTVEAAVFRNGTFRVSVGTTYTVLGVTLGYKVTVSNTGITASFDGTAKWAVRAQIPHVGTISVTARATFHADLTVSYVNGDLKYTGSVTATGKVGRYFSGRIGARVTGDRILFDFPLGIGEVALPLP